jgi:hypothetical protein
MSNCQYSVQRGQSKKSHWDGAGGFITIAEHQRMLHFHVFIYSLSPHTVGCYSFIKQREWLINYQFSPRSYDKRIHRYWKKNIFLGPQNPRPAQISSDVCVTGRTDSSHFRVFHRDAIKTPPPHGHLANTIDAWHGTEADSDSVMSSETITWWSINQAIKVSTMPITLFNKHTLCTHRNAEGGQQRSHTDFSALPLLES